MGSKPNVRRIERTVMPEFTRVAAYARVSKDTPELMHSLSAQISYYSSLIQNTPGWIYAGVYVDAGITGTNAAARPEFQRMIQDAENGKFKILLTKSISRFARNTVDLLATIRRFKELGIDVRFEREHISTMSGDGEVMLSILASFAESESVSLSQNIKWTFQKKYKSGEVHSHQKMLGYDWVGNELVINQAEAEAVRFIYRLYLEGQSYEGIARELDRRGIKSIRSKTFPAASVKAILVNEQYTGCLIMQRYYNPRPKTVRINNGQLPKYMIENHHPAIISPETFAAVRKAMDEKRNNIIDRRDGVKSVFTGKVWCGKCGRHASWHRTPQSRAKADNSSMLWICERKNKDHSCDCRNIQDRELASHAEAAGLEIGRIEKITVFDNKLEYTLFSGKKTTVHRTDIDRRYMKRSAAPESEAGIAPKSEAGIAPESEAGIAPGSEAGTAPEIEAGIAPGNEAGTAPGND